MEKHLIKNTEMEFGWSTDVSLIFSSKVCCLNFIIYDFCVQTPSNNILKQT